jgi:hypothetical protein
VLSTNQNVGDNTMKLKSIILFVAVLTLAACSKDLLDVSFDANYKTDLAVEVDNAKAENGSFDTRDTIDLASDAEAAKYLERIKKWEMTGFEGEFKNLSEEFNVISAKVTIESGDRKAEWSFSNISVIEAYALLLANDNGQFDLVNQILEEKGTFIITFSGLTDKKGINFDLGLNVKTKVTANPLD